MTIQTMTFAQVAKAVSLTREQLYITLRAAGLIVSTGFIRIHQTRGGSLDYWMNERFEGDYVINGHMGFRGDNGQLVPTQVLDSRIIEKVKEVLHA